MAYRKHSRKHSRKHRGGAGAADPSSYSSAATYMLKTVGTGNEQYNNVFSQSGPDANSQANVVVGLQGQRAGSRKRRSHSRSKKGGFWSQIVNQAIVPFSILGLQQTYRRKRQGGAKTHRRR